MGIVYLSLFVRLIIKLNKRLRSRKFIKAHFTFKNIKWLVDTLFSTVAIAGFYLIPTIVIGTSYEHIAMTAPASMVTAEIALWVMALYSLGTFLAKVLVSPLKTN